MAYSRYAQFARAEYLKENKELPSVNYIGPARTYHAAKAGRKRIAGYSVARQGGREAARQRAEERKTKAFDRLSSARTAAFTGLNEKTPALDAHFGTNRPESSSRGGAAKDTGPRGSMGAHPDTGPRGTMGAWGQKKSPVAPAPAAPAPLPGFPAPAENAGQTVGGLTMDAFRKNRMGS